MKIVLDWMLIIISTTMVLISIKDILKKKICAMDFCIIIFYIFNCFPILLDYIIGKPVYNTWFYGFNNAMQNEDVGVMYDVYMLISIIIFMFYKVLKNGKSKTSIISKTNECKGTYKKILILITILPHLYIVLTGNISNFMQYKSLAQRNLGEASVNIINLLNQFSIVAFSYLYFCASNVKTNKLILILYSLSICWIDGKRYMVVTILLLYAFLYTNSEKFKTISYRKMLKYTIVGITLLSIFYINYTNNKMKTVYSTKESEISFYTDFRINFGRDDVIKFVIMKEFIEKEPILEYKGQSVLSSVFMFVPRSIWANKPYPHYRYLSAAIYNESVDTIPSGMTPSIFDMGIANFSYLGIIITPIIMAIICSITDNTKRNIEKGIYVIMISNLLTQSLDAAIGYILILILMFLYKILTKKGKKSEKFIQEDYQ